MKKESSFKDNSSKRRYQKDIGIMLNCLTKKGGITNLINGR